MAVCSATALFRRKGNALPVPLPDFYLSRAGPGPADCHSRSTIPDGMRRIVPRGLLMMALAVTAAAQTQPQQGPAGVPVRKSPLADYAGMWTGAFEGKTWMTVRLALQGDRLSGSIQHARELQFNDLGEIKSVSDEQSTEVVQQAEVNPNGLLLTTKDPDTQETDHFTMKLTGESTAEIKMNAMKMPPGMPKIKPWKLTRAAGPAAAPR